MTMALQSLSPPHSFGELRRRRALVLRVAVDLAGTWAAFLFGWFVVGGNDVAALAEADSQLLISLIAGLSLAGCVGLAAMGLYTSHHMYSLSIKLRRIAALNFALFVFAGMVLTLVDRPAALTAALLFTTFAGSAFLLGVARVASGVLRSEDRGDQATHRQPDERKVLVIGGGGYIGSALVEQLLGLGLHVTVFDALHFGEGALARVSAHPNLTLVREDFRHIEALTCAMDGVGSVIHLGGLVGDPACAVDSNLTVDVNVTATNVIGEIAKASGVRRFIFASSCSVYGACDEVVDEDARFNPQSLYARSKVASEAVLRRLNTPGFAVTCLRFATIYGISGRTRFDLVVNLLCAKAARDGLITVYGADQWRPFVHVEDVARAIITTLKAPIDVVAGEAFNVGSDAQNYTLGEVAAMIKQQVPDAAIVSDDTFVDRRNYRVSFLKIRSLLGFEPAWTLERGIAQVLALVRTNQIGDYAHPTYSNFLYLKACGTQSFGQFKISGWENELMSIDRIVTKAAPGRPAAA